MDVNQESTILALLHGTYGKREYRKQKLLRGLQENVMP